MFSEEINLCLAVPWLYGPEGHYFGYYKSIFQAASSRKMLVKVWGDKDCSDLVKKSLPFVPVFQRPIANLTKGVGVLRPAKNILHLLSDLNHVDIEALDSKWLVFIEPLYHTHVLSWALFPWRFHTRRAPTFMVMLRQGYYQSIQKRWGRGVTYMRIALRLWELSAHFYQVRLVTDSDHLADEYRSLTSLPLSVLPIPHTETDEFPVSQQLAVMSDSVVKFVFLGHMRLEKGFGLLSKAIRQLHEQGKMDRIRFVLQAIVKHEQGFDVMQSQLQELINLRLLNVQIISEPQDQDEYVRLLKDSNFVLLPYAQEAYYSRTSGPFTEALAFGKPVIVTDNTWMSDQLERHGAGIKFRDQDVDDLARAICEARDNCHDLTRKAYERRQNWLDYHNPYNFITELRRIVQR